MIHYKNDGPNQYYDPNGTYHEQNLVPEQKGFTNWYVQSITTGSYPRFGLIGTAVGGGEIIPGGATPYAMRICSAQGYYYDTLVGGPLTSGGSVYLYGSREENKVWEGKGELVQLLMSSVPYDFLGTGIKDATPIIPIIPLDRQAKREDIKTVGEPINVANGNMFTSLSEVSIPSGKLPLELSLTYNSQDDFQGSFGYGWRSNFDTVLSEQPDSSVIEVDETGVYTIYTKNADNSYTPSAGKYSVLTKNADGSFQILRKHGKKLLFDSSGLLIRIEDRNANYIAIQRNANGLISEVTDSSGRKLLFTTNPQGKVTQVTDPKERVFKYEYDAGNNLTKAIDPLNQETSYAYDANHNLTQKTDPNNHCLYFEYDSSDRAYRSFQDNHNNEVTLSFDTANKTTTLTNSLGNTTKYEYNDYGLVTKITDPQNNIQTFVWDNNLNKTSITNQNGFNTLFTYDQRGNLLTTTDALSNIITFTYEPDFDFIASTTDALGNTTIYSYDPKGNLIQLKDALNNITTYSYTTEGLLNQLKDANNNLTLFTYDSFGNLTQITDSLNNVTGFSYDILGNKTQTTDSLGSTTTFTYDLLNRLTQITYADNSKVTHSYDPVGNLISSTDQNNNTTTYAYDVADRLTQATDAQGNTTTFTYDTEGNRTQVSDSLGNITAYTYDSLNRLIETQDPLNNQTLFSYDPAGNLISTTDANGNTTSYEYDALNRLTKETDANNNTTQYLYDSVGNRVSVTDAKGNATSYTYDPLNRITKTTFPDASFETYSYDNVGNMTQKLTRKAESITFSYDSLNRLIKKTYPNSAKVIYSYDSLSRILRVTDSSGTMSHTYNTIGRLTSVRSPNGMTVSYQYDPAGNKTKLTYPDKTYLTYTYDSLNRLNTIKDQASSTIASFTYDNLSRRTTLALANGVTTSYIYDQDSRLLSLANKKGSSILSSFNYSYDPQGNRLSMLTKQGTFNYAYDNIDQLTQAQKPNLPAATYSFDVLGNRIKLTNSLTQDYTSNNLNQYTQITNGLTATNLSYDKNGNLISERMLNRFGRPVRLADVNFSYDCENRLTKVARPLFSVSFTYDAFGRRAIKKLNNRIQEKYIYDQDNVILDLDSYNRITAKYIYPSASLGTGGPDTDEPLLMIKTLNPGSNKQQTQRYYYLKDGLGSVAALTNSQGRIVESYAYDEYGRPLSGSLSGNRYLFTAREYDRETGLYYYRARYYDPGLGRFLQADPVGYAGGINLYAYVKNNPINWVDPWGLCKKNKIELQLDPLKRIKEIMDEIDKWKYDYDETFEKWWWTYTHPTSILQTPSFAEQLNQKLINEYVPWTIWCAGRLFYNYKVFFPIEIYPPPPGWKPEDWYDWYPWEI